MYLSCSLFFLHFEALNMLITIDICMITIICGHVLLFTCIRYTLKLYKSTKLSPCIIRYANSR